MRILIMIFVTFLLAALFAMGIFLFAKPTEIRELLEPIQTFDYQPNFAPPLQYADDEQEVPEPQDEITPQAQENLQPAEDGSQQEQEQEQGGVDVTLEQIELSTGEDLER